MENAEQPTFLRNIDSFSPTDAPAAHDEPQEDDFFKNVLGGKAKNDTIAEESTSAFNLFPRNSSGEQETSSG